MLWLDNSKKEKLWLELWGQLGMHQEYLSRAYIVQTIQSPPSPIFPTCIIELIIFLSRHHCQLISLMFQFKFSNWSSTWWITIILPTIKLTIYFFFLLVLLWRTSLTFTSLSPTTIATITTSTWSSLWRSAVFKKWLHLITGELKQIG